MFKDTAQCIQLGSTVRKKHTTLSHMTSNDNQSKPTSSLLFPSEMFAKPHNITRTINIPPPPQNKESHNKQRITSNRTTALEETAAQATRGLSQPHRPNIDPCSAAVKAQTPSNQRGGLLTYRIHQQRENKSR